MECAERTLETCGPPLAGGGAAGVGSGSLTRCEWFNPEECSTAYRGGCYDMGSCFKTGGRWCTHCHDWDMRARWCHQCPEDDPWAYRPSRCVDECSTNVFNPATVNCKDALDCNQQCDYMLEGCALSPLNLCQAAAWRRFGGTFAWQLQALLTVAVVLGLSSLQGER